MAISQQHIQGLPTFSAAGAFTPPATPTDLVTIYGASTRTIRVVSFRIGATNTAAGSQEYFLIKRTAVNTAGTFVSATRVPLDSQNLAVQATSVGHYTANPSGLGAAAGTLAIRRHASPVAKPATFAGIVEEVGFELLCSTQYQDHHRPVTLRGTSEGLVINFNGAALVAGQTHIYTIMWTEEP